MGLGDREICVYDQRNEDQSVKVINLPLNASYEDLKSEIFKNFSSGSDFVISTTNRDEINSDDVVSLLEDRDMLYLLHKLDQELVSQTKQQVQFLPHYDTLVKSGMYEYYNSEGQNPLPYAFAELIDNSLAATANNVGNRDIQLRLMLDDQNPEKSIIFVIDNGRGMTSYQLNNWAIYRLSKFIRQDKSFKLQNDIPHSPTSPKKPIPRSLNSEISYFGVGGKQAIFFIGNGTRMITKPKDSLDVHELCISKEQFEQKEQQKEFVYSGEIRNRKLADSSHLSDDDVILKKIIAEEEGKENFTCVVINGIAPEHIAYLKQHYDTLCTQLAHIYHYYIHGPNGNDLNTNKECDKILPLQLRNIDIQVQLLIKGRETEDKNLRDIDDDMQTKYIQSSHSSFEFKASVEGCKSVEGIIRYHPFLYDQETYPSDPFEKKMIPDDDNLNQTDIYPARGRRAIFECFWNGRLIPYTPVRDFEWCMPSKKQRNQIPPECYNRISGVLWTNDDFQVSTNKLTFLDLENRMKDNSTIFHRIINGQEKRGLIEKQFNEWLMICHEKCDKQILFKDFQGHIARADQPKLRQFPWAVFNSIEWDGRVFAKSQRIRTQRTLPVVLGTIKRFYLYGEYDENDVYATGGDFEIQLEPLSMFSESKSFPLSKLDRKADDATIKKALENEEDKLPHRLIVNWPEGDQLYANERRPAGKTIGAIKVEISNKKGELISKIPGTNKKLLIDLKLKWHSPKGDVVLSHFLSSHAKTWPYWFRKMDNVKELGAYSLILQAVVNDTETEIVGKVLPSYQIKFSVTEGPPERFSIGLLEGPFKVGVPFNIPLEFHDKFGNSAKPNETFRPLLHAPGASLDFEGVAIKGNTLLVKAVTALALVESQTGKNFQLSVKVLGLEKESHTMKMRLLPGPPMVLMVKPESEMIEIENGTPISFDIVCVDASANVTVESKLIVTCKFACKNLKDLPSYKVDISSSGKGILTGPPLLLQNFSGNELVVAKIQAVNRPEIEVVQKKILVQPSRRASSLRITYIGEEGSKTDLEPDCEVTWLAGEIIKGLEFLVYDEGGRPIKITQSLASKLKVNWVSRGVKDLFMAGKLPDITTPMSVSQQLFCNVTLSEANVIDFGFTIKPIPGPEFAIKAYCETTSELRLGETLSSNILIDVLDRHSNRVTKITSKSLANLQIICEDLDVTSVEKYPGKKSSFLVKNIKFTDGKLGDKELLFKWNDLKDTVHLEVIAGSPSKIFYPNYNPKEFISLCGDSFLPYPIIVQLSDALDHPVKISGVKVQLGTDEALKINPVVHALKTNELGRVDFGEIKVELKQNQILPKCPALICANTCRGVYSLCAKAVYQKKAVIGPILKLHMLCDPTKAVSIKVDYDFKEKTFEINKEFPDFVVSVISENGSPMKSIKNAQLKMRINPYKLVKPTSTPTRVIVCPSTDARDSNSLFFFKKKHVPTQVGVYNIDFAYTTNTLSLTSEKIQVTVVAGPAKKLVAEQDPGLPAVSNTAKFASRCLINHLKLHFEDAKDNVTGSKLSGTLHVQITSKENISKVELPKMAGNVTSIEVPIVHGQCNLQNVMIEENSPGVDGKEYILRCTPKFRNAHTDIDVAPYDVRFIFCNDSNKQAEFSQMSKERDNLLSIIKTYQTLFDTSRQLLKELEEAASSAAAEENRVKEELRHVNFNATSLTSIDKVNQTIAKLAQNRSKLIRAPKRVFGMTPAPDEPGVLGKIGQLAYVVDDDVAKVLSWHMQSDIDCVVTQSMEKARELHRRMSGRMQLLPLDSIYKRNLPDWSRPLIHTKIRNYRPTGNPIYARDCLIFQKEPENCRLVFGMLLGDTIILDSLEEATHYREMIVKHMFCPTLLARTGERIRSNGKFGGQQNKAPSIDKLRGLVFGEPPQNQFQEIQQQIELLETLKLAVVKSIQTRADLHEQQRQENSLIMLEKVKEFHAAQKQLKDIENKLSETGSVAKGSKRLSNGNTVAQSLKRLESTKERVEDGDFTFNGLGGLGLTRSQMMKLKSQALDGISPSHDSPTSRKKRKV